MQELLTELIAFVQDQPFEAISAVVGGVFLIAFLIALVVMGITSIRERRRIRQITGATRPHFVVKQKRGGAPPIPDGTPFQLKQMEPSWGSVIKRPESIAVRFNQKTCRICHQSIDQGFVKKGWVRCLGTQELVHGQCYEAAAKFPGCGDSSIQYEGRGH